MLVRSHILFFLVIILTAVLAAIPPGQKSITDFAFQQTPEGRWISGNKLATLAPVNPDYFEDVVIASTSSAHGVEEQALAVYLNLGNGYFSAKPNARIQLPAAARELTIRQSGRLETLAIIRYENNQEQEFNLSQLFAYSARETQTGYPPHKVTNDSLNFLPVWSWTFPYNWGSWPVTAGDIDNDGRVEIISSMTHPDSIEVGWLIILENDGDNNYREDLIIPLNFHSWVHQIKITDWDQDGNKELTCAVGYRIRIWEFYGDKNFQYFDTNISFGGMKACSGIEAVDTDQNGQLELLAIFHDHDAPSWRSMFARYEFFTKSPPYFSFSNVVLKLSSGWFYSFAAGDMDNDGLIDILPGYAQLGGPGPVAMYNEEFDPNQMEFIPRYFTYPYPIVQGFNVIDDLDGDSLNEVFITGVGNGYGGIIYLKSDAPDHYQILNVDSTLLKSAGSAVKTTFINNQKYITKAAAIFDFNQNNFIYFIEIFLRLANNSFNSVWAGPEYELGSYIHSFEILDTDNDELENIIYKLFQYSHTDLRDIEESPISSIDPPTGNKINEFTLYQNYPNPFNPETTISFNSPAAGQVSIAIYDIQGKLIKKFSPLFAHPGLNRVAWNGTNNAGNPVASGVYFYRLSVVPPISEIVRGGAGLTRKMLLIR